MLSDHRLPVRPDLDQLKHQAKDLLRGVRTGDPAALEEFSTYHPHPPDREDAKLADAQFALARSYDVPSWMRLVQACNLVDAIWRNDIDAVRNLVTKNPNLIHESALVRESNWGPPMSYAANIGRDEIIQMLHDMGAKDHEHAVGRAALQSKIGTAKLLHKLMDSPVPPPDALGGPAYTLSASGTELLLELGLKVVDENGKLIAPVAVVIESDSRKPSEKHRILELYVEHGAVLPDTPVMALHMGRIDLLEDHLRRDPELLSRTFTHEEIYPPDLGCNDEVLATQGTPLKGTTLLHMCVDFDEMEIAKWLIGKGADVNARAAVDENGFGGHTPLFNTVMSQPNFWMNYLGGAQEAPYARLLLDNGADVMVKASLRKKLHPGYAPRYDTENWHEYRDVTAREWGEQFHAKVFVSEPAMALIREKENE